MKISYEITREDYWNFTKYGILHIPNLRNQVIESILTPSIIVFWLGIREGLSTFNILFNIIEAIVLFSLGMLYIKKSHAMKFKDSDKPGILCEHTSEITVNGFREQTKFNDSFESWERVRHIESDKNYIYIYTCFSTGNLIPKRAFTSNEDAEQFYNTAVSYWKEHKEQQI
jgi:hypothetical protein